MNLRNFKITENLVARGKVIFEWGVIALWSLWIGRDYLNLSLDMWPTGGQEYIMSMQNQYVWTLLPKCGVCFFWNGFTNGGAPSFIDVHGAWLHPIVIIATFVFGVFNSGKIIVLVSLFMAGVGQWWMGKILKIGMIARLWTALVMVASGALAGRMEVASVPLVLSTAACCVVFPAVLQLGIYGGKKAAIALGVILGLAMLAGQGYLQIGLIFSLIPIFVVFLALNHAESTVRIKIQWRYFFFSLMLGALIAAPLIIPLAHFSSMIGKDSDPTFGTAQPLEFNVLNLVINNQAFYFVDALGKQPFPYLYINYIGWIPVIFSIMGITLAPQEMRKIIIGMGLAIVFVYLASSAIIFKWMSLIPLADFVTGIQNPGPIQGLAVPLILGIAGRGVERLFKAEFLRIKFRLSKINQKFSDMTLNIWWIVIGILLGVALYSVSDFSKNWLYLAKNDQDVNHLIQYVKTPDAQWVQPPYGQYIWLPAAIDNGMKIRLFFRPWRFASSVLPPAYLEMSTIAENAKLPEAIGVYDNYVILKHPDSLYASVMDNDEKVKPCKTTSSLGGFVDVVCDISTPGKLTVMENAVNGWIAMRDGEDIPLQHSEWLVVDAVVGKHNYEFRYQPWDAPLGIGFALFGWGIVIFGLFFDSKRKKNPAN